MNNNQDLQSIIDEVIENTDIVDTIGQYVHLEKKGSDYIGLCPFHDDKNPSMHVSPSKHIFKCFSCNTGGNAITFVQKFKNISFMDALRELAQKAGIEIAMTAKEKEELKNKKYYDITKDASDFFKFYLKNSVDAKEAIEYLKDRQLDDEIIKRFNIGLAPNSDNALYEVLKSRHLGIDMVSAGVAREYDGKYFDVFKNRIVFPITNLDGKIVGFSGRKYLPQDNEPKYVNSVENVIFKKGQILYNYADAYSEIKAQKRVYLFEGFMDVIAAYRAGVLNAVASMGTALTVGQIMALKKISDTIIVCYDGDDPGVEATNRAISLIIQNGMNVLCVAMPDELDPDEYINEYGKNALHDYLVNNTISGIEYLYLNAKDHLDKSDFFSIESFKNKVFGFMSYFNSSVLTEMILTKMSQDLGISIESLLSDYKQKSSSPTFINKLNANKPKFSTNTKRIYTEKYINAENQLLCIAYKHIDKVPEIVSKLEYSYVSEKNSDLINKIFQIKSSDDMINTTADLSVRLSKDDLEFINEILSEMPSEPSIQNIDILCDTIKEHTDYKRYAELKSLCDNGTLPNEEIQEFLELKKKLVKKKGDK